MNAFPQRSVKSQQALCPQRRGPWWWHLPIRASVQETWPGLPVWQADMTEGGSIPAPSQNPTGLNTNRCQPRLRANLPCPAYLTRAHSAVTNIPAVYTSPLAQPAGTIQYTPLPPNLHFISSPYSAPYAGYISPLVPHSVATTTTQREIYASTSSSPRSKIDQHHQLGRPSGMVTTDNTSSPHSTQYIQIAGSPLSLSPRTTPSPHAHFPSHLHPHHTLPISGPMPVFHITHTDGPLPKREETRPREVLNGELEKDRRFGLSPESSAGKQGSTAKGCYSTQQHQIHQQQSQRHYEARHVMLPAEYAQDSAAMRTSLVLVPNSHSSGGADPRGTPDKLSPPTSHSEKGGICAGKPVSRSSSFSVSLPFPPPPPPVDNLKGAITTLSPHTVIQTTHNSTESLSLGLPSTNFYSAQQPIIGYIAGTGHQQPLSYHTSLIPAPGHPWNSASHHPSEWNWSYCYIDHTALHCGNAPCFRHLNGPKSRDFWGSSPIPSLCCSCGSSPVASACGSSPCRPADYSAATLSPFTAPLLHQGLHHPVGRWGFEAGRGPEDRGFHSECWDQQWA